MEKFDARPCKAEDIGLGQFKTGQLFVCPPLESDLKMYETYINSPNK